MTLWRSQTTCDKTSNGILCKFPYHQPCRLPWDENLCYFASNETFDTCYFFRFVFQLFPASPLTTVTSALFLFLKDITPSHTLSKKKTKNHLSHQYLFTYRCACILFVVQSVYMYKHFKQNISSSIKFL